jgi:hypothetical protein
VDNLQSVKKMKILFCSDPLHSSHPDEMYQTEANAVNSLGYSYSLIDYEALVNDNDPIKAVRRISAEETIQHAIYRGWMLKPFQYEQLYKALFDKNITLINDPPAYRHCHYLPESYSIIKFKTPESIWLSLKDASIDEIMKRLQVFGDKPVVVKDFVKSQKHYWSEAFYIPSAAVRESVERVVNKFIELQGEDLNEGLVFREFIEFEPLAVHSKSGMPLKKEYRVFVLDGTPFYVSEYWEEGEYKGQLPALDEFKEIMLKVKSRFFTMDIAKKNNGDWMIVELGDGQVAGLPEKIKAEDFYKSIAERIK